MNSIWKAYSHDKEKEKNNITTGGLIEHKWIRIIQCYEVSTPNIQNGFTMEELWVNYMILFGSVTISLISVANHNQAMSE
jgi:hypothetical protein